MAHVALEVHLRMGMVRHARSCSVKAIALLIGAEHPRICGEKDWSARHLKSDPYTHRATIPIRLSCKVHKTRPDRMTRTRKSV